MKNSSLLAIILFSMTALICLGFELASFLEVDASVLNKGFALQKAVLSKSEANPRIR